MKRFTETDKWRDSWFRGLPYKAKLAWVYICDNCDKSGVWDCDFALACFCIGEDIPWSDIERTFQDRIKVLNGGGKWWIVKFIDFQYGSLNESNPLHKSVWESLNKHNLSGAYKALRRGSGSPQGKEEVEEEEVGGKESEENQRKSDLRKRVSALFGRRESTPWTEKETRSFSNSVPKTHPEDLALIEEFYLAKCPSDRADYRRKDLGTLLNNWSGEIDRARKWKKTGFDQRPDSGRDGNNHQPSSHLPLHLQAL